MSDTEKSKAAGKVGLHKIELSERRKVTVTDVSDVLAFDEEYLSLKIGDSVLSVYGREIRITLLSLENGTVEAEGDFSGFSYEEKTGKNKSGLFRRRG